MLQMRGRTSRGFTLIELLVVIAIVAILAAILFPVFLTAKRSALKSQCLSNVAQLSKAVITYASDYEGRIPRWQFGPNSAPTAIWDKAVYSYVKNAKIYSCPANKIDKRPGSAGYGKPWRVLIRSYALPKNVSGQIVEQAPKPSMTVLLYEKGSQPLFVQADATGEWFTQTYGIAQDPDHMYYHEGGKNFAFCDGHAKFFRYKDGPFKYNYPNFTAWSTEAYPNNPGGDGYCGWANFTAGADPDDGKVFGGANLPR